MHGSDLPLSSFHPHRVCPHRQQLWLSLPVSTYQLPVHACCGQTAAGCRATVSGPQRQQLTTELSFEAGLHKHRSCANAVLDRKWECVLLPVYTEAYCEHVLSKNVQEQTVVKQSYTRPANGAGQWQVEEGPNIVTFFLVQWKLISITIPEQHCSDYRCRTTAKDIAIKAKKKLISVVFQSSAAKHVVFSFIFIHWNEVKLP